MNVFAKIERTIRESAWRRDDGAEFSGEELYARGYASGWFVDWRQLADVPVGGCVKTGVSTYQRVR